MNTIESIFFFILALSLLVLVHEWGHYYVARRGGVRVLRFSIGFGPELLGFTKGDTRWSVCAIPFGGYVKFAGDNPEEGREGASDEFLSKGVGIRSAIVVAGQLMNYILAILLYGAVLWAEGIRVFPEPRIGSVVEESLADGMGIQVDDLITAVNGKPVTDLLEVDSELAKVEDSIPFTLTVDRAGQSVELTGKLNPDEPVFGVSFYAPPLVGGVRRASPAWNAGLREGDKIVAVDGTPVDRWSSLQEMISDRPEVAVALDFERDGTVLQTTVTPEGEKVSDGDGGMETVGRIGILQHIEKESVGPMAALAGGTKQVWALTRGVLELIPRLPGMIFSALFMGADDGGLGGPVRMAQMFGDAARWGLLSFLTLMAFISTQLAIFNLLPIPVLDGGHLALYAVEVIMRRPPPLRVRIILQQIGFALLLLLMLSVTVMDIGRAFG
ncbi:MAG: RIP metalloprotease RseP [Gemmatimonadetes bacterium]|nr:RIP metalloprotease RseP [Gemmatimonadota bacterium]